MTVAEMIKMLEKVKPEDRDAICVAHDTRNGDSSKVSTYGCVEIVSGNEIAGDLCNMAGKKYLPFYM